MGMTDELEFPGVKYGKERIALTLKPCLYLNGAGCHAKKFQEECSIGCFDDAVDERRPLIYALHAQLNGIVSSGKSVSTLRTGVGLVRALYAYSDKMNLHPTMANASSLYCGWVKSLHQKNKSDDFKNSGCYHAASGMATLLGNATGLGRNYFVLQTSLTPPKKNKGFLEIDKQSLGDARRFIADLIDIRDCLGIKAFQQPLPVALTMSDGVCIKLYSGLTQHEKLLPHKLADTSLKVRYAIYNLRAESELMIFISQTSMNLSDAANLETQDFRYYTTGDSFEARAYKGRKKGEVIFTAYGGYRPYFLEFLAFRNEMKIGVHTNKLFGKLPQSGKSVSDNPNPRALTRLMKSLRRPMVVAGELRKTRQNWLARRIGDPALAAEMGQHELTTFMKDYSRPHHQTATTEWSNYFRSHTQDRRAAFEGNCNGTPIPIEELPSTIDKPNCLNPHLCIYCLNYKGVKTYAYIWSLLSYKVLREREKLIVLRGNGDVSGLDATLGRIEHIIASFERAGKKCAGWLGKATQAILAGHYHPRWNGFIELIEISGI